jgi:hypothetical protein
MKKSKYVGLLLLGLLVIAVTGGVWTSNQFIYKPSLGARGQTEKDRFDVSMDRVDNRLGKEIWVGDPNYGTTFQDAITAIGSTSAMLHIPAGTHDITANLTIPVNVTLKPERGATLTVTTTKILTINGGLDAGLYQVFSCSGTGTVVFGNKVPKVYVQWFGAKGDGSTDDGVVINQAATCARASTCKTIIFPAVGYSTALGYKTTNQLDLRQLNIEASGTEILSDFDGDATVLAGGPAGANSAHDLTGDLSVRHTVGDWVAGTVGIKCSDADASKWVFSARGFETGIEFVAGVASCSYNNIILKTLYSNKVGFLAYCPAGVAGWVNENKVFGGNFGGSAGAGQGTSIKLKGETGCANRPSGWVFYSPSLEHGDGVGVICDNAVDNSVLDIRYEQGRSKVAQFINGSVNNLVTMNSYYASVDNLGYDFDIGASPTDTSHANDVRMNKERPYQRFLDVTTFDAAYTSGGQLHIPGFEFISTSGVISHTVATSNINLRDHGVGVSPYFVNNNYGIGRKIAFVDSPTYNTYRPQKIYALAKSAFGSSTNTQLMVWCFDSNMTPLHGTSPYYVKGYKATSVSNYYTLACPNATYTTGQILLFHPDVIYAFIGIMGGSNPIGLELTSPYFSDPIPTVGPNEHPGYRIASASPTAWHFQQGEVVWNSAATSGAPPGWMCIKRTDTTLTGNGSGGNTTITVNSITGIASGDNIGVKLNTGLYHFTTVNGAPSGNTVTLTAAIPGSGVVATSGNAVVANLWRALPNL